MLTKDEVIKALFEGKKLRRSNWLQANNSYIAYSTGGGVAFYTHNKLAIENYDIVFGLHMFDNWEVMKPVYTFQDLKLGDKFIRKDFNKDLIFQVVSVPRGHEFFLEGLCLSTGHVYLVFANEVVKRIEN